MSQIGANFTDPDEVRPRTLAAQLCQHVHPSTFAEQVFGACDTCKRYTLAVIESDWLTHYVADHTGGLAAICDKYGLPHAASALERHLINASLHKIAMWKSTAEFNHTQIVARLHRQLAQRYGTTMADHIIQTCDLRDPTEGVHTA